MKFKKILGMLLAITMLMSTTNIAIADFVPGGFPDIKDNTNAHAISYLKALDTLKADGDTGNFRPDHFLSRQEFAVIIARIGDPIPGIDITVNQSPGGNPPPPPPPPSTVAHTIKFTDYPDIADWARDSVNFVTENGWVKGYVDGGFGPKNNLTDAEAITVLLRVLGYENTIDESQWPAAYITKAEELGMNASVDSTSGNVITRAEMAQLTYNTLFIPRQIEQNGEWIKVGSMIRTITEVDKDVEYLNGDSLKFYVGDLDSDGYGDTISAYQEIISPSGETVEIWRYLQRIKELTIWLTDTDENSSQRVADLKKLADELVNIVKLDTDISNTGQVDIDLDSDPPKLIADLKKLADELVNAHELAQEVILIGANSSKELIGTKVRATFNADGQIYIIEARSTFNDLDN